MTPADRPAPQEVEARKHFAGDATLIEFAHDMGVEPLWLADWIVRLLLAAGYVPKEEARRQAVEECITRLKSATVNDCDHLGMMDPETGQRECRVEVRGGDCLCADRIEQLDEAVTALRALTRPETEKADG